jgi:hypothetical protein
MKVCLRKVKNNFRVPSPPLIPRLNALFQNGKMFWVGHDSSMPAPGERAVTGHTFREESSRPAPARC